MDSSPLVSIITPSYNQGPFIEATIRSVFEQDYPRIEYIVMDGGSSDQTLAILRRYEGQLTWTSSKDNGQADAINRGIAASHGQYVTWLNSDDTLAPGAISAAAGHLADHPDTVLVYGNADFIDPAGRFLAHCPIVEPPNRHRLLHYGDYIVQPASLFRRDAFDAVGGLDASLQYAMDYDLWLKLSKKHAISHIPRTLAQYRWFGENKSAVGGRVRLEEVRKVARRHGLKRLPAFFTLEEIRLRMAEGFGQLKSAQPLRAAISFGGAAAHLLASPRAIKSLLCPRTWQTIRTGRVLRSVRPPSLD